MDDGIAAEFEKRDRVRRHQQQSRTLAERMEAFRMLQARSWEILKGNPDGYSHFLRRNFKARAIANGNKHDRQ